MVNVQEWLDREYPKEKKENIREIRLDNWKNNREQIEGKLIISDFSQLEKINLWRNDLTELQTRNCPRLFRINCTLNRQLESLIVNNCPQLKELDTSRCYRLTNLNLKGADNLEKLSTNCNHQLAELALLTFANLRELYCSANFFFHLDLSQNRKLEHLDISNNNLAEQDLSMFSCLTHLKDLRLGNWDKKKFSQGIYNRFYGSLEHLKNLSKLEYLDISNTDIDSGVEYLPDSLRNYWTSTKQWGTSVKKQKILYSTLERPQSKVKEISEQLTNFLEYGLCRRCQKIINEYNRCLYCDKDANQTIQDFIQRHKKLKWIPYEQFKVISDKPIGEGGFGKVYKTLWANEGKIVALKVLNNSQVISENFLQEISNYQILFDYDRIVNCYGISQDPKTKNYLIVMDYIKDSDLKSFLQNNLLSLKDKIRALRHVIIGLNNIHNHNLMHHDFHSGNILSEKEADNSSWYITDLGLCRPVNETDNGKIYGVLPYVAPEVLGGKLYTQASDIYSFGIIAYELLANAYPYADTGLHNTDLALAVCQGLRPNIDKFHVPKLLKNLIKNCWDADPDNRPKSKELRKTLEHWHNQIRVKKNKINTEFCQQYQEVAKAEQEKLCKTLTELYQDYKRESREVKPEEIEKVKKELFERFYQRHNNKKNSKEEKKKAKKEFEKLLIKKNNLTYQTHPQAIYNSRFLDFKNLPKPQNSKEVNDEFYNSKQNYFSQPIEFSTTEVQKALEEMSINNDDQFSRPINFNTAELNQVNWEEIIEEPTEWTALHISFTSWLISQWQYNNFTCNQCKDWLSIGLKPTNYQFCTWLRDIKKVDAEWVLNHGNLEQLNQEFFNWWQEQQQARIEIAPK